MSIDERITGREQSPSPRWRISCLVAFLWIAAYLWALSPWAMPPSPVERENYEYKGVIVGDGPESPAGEAGLKKGDRIIMADDQQVNSYEDMSYATSHTNREKQTLKVVRDGKVLAIDVNLSGTPALYVIENMVSANGIVDTRCLARLLLDREYKTAKETLLCKDQGFFGHFGGHRLALNRFIVTCHGGVIDIPSNRVIHDEQDGELLGLDDEKAVYRIRNSNRMSGLFAFDLSARTLAKVENGGHWDLPGAVSPDKTMSVNEDHSDSTLRLHQLGKETRVLGKGFRVAYSPLAGVREGVPSVWLDSKRILTIEANNKLVVLTTQGTVEKAIEVKDAPGEVLSPPRLRLDKQEQVIYSCGEKEFLIDSAKGVSSPLKSYFLGHGFEASVDADKKQRRMVHHNGNAIGQWVFDPLEAKTAPGSIAFAYVQPAEHANLGQPEGVAVWHARVADWRRYKMWVNDIIGWSE
jgi:hypothetical protein